MNQNSQVAAEKLDTESLNLLKTSGKSGLSANSSGIYVEIHHLHLIHYCNDTDYGHFQMYQDICRIRDV